MVLSTEIRDQIVAIEDRLERVELRRSVLPAGMLLFAVMAGFMFWTEILDALGARVGAAWLVSFAVGTIAVLALNELTASRTIRVLKDELKALRAQRDRVLREGAGE